MDIPSHCNKYYSISTSENIGDIITNSNMIDINTSIRKGNADQENIRLYKNIDQFFLCLPPILEELTVYRGVSLNNIEELANPNPIYVHTSLSTNKNFKVNPNSGCCKLKITVLPGVKAWYNIAGFEKEVVLDRGGTYCIIDTLVKKDLKETTLVCLYISRHAVIMDYINCRTIDTIVANADCLYTPSAWLFDELVIDDYKALYDRDVNHNSKLNPIITSRDDKTSLRLMTWNVHEYKDSNIGKIIDTIRTINPDIVALQEATGEVNIEEYPYQYAMPSEEGIQLFLVILSKYEITDKKFHQNRINANYRNYISCKVKFGKKELEFYNLHLNPVAKFAKSQWNSLEKSKDAYVLGDMNMINVADYEAAELEWIKDHSPEGYESIRYANNKSHKSFMERHKLLSVTKGVKYTSMYGRKVDHIIIPKKVWILNQATFYTTTSDHLPYFMDVKFF